MKAQHTAAYPTTWEYDEELEKEIRWTDDSTYEIRMTPEERLIAAAPELLDALERAVSRLQDLGQANMIHDLHAIIAKTKGE